MQISITHSSRNCSLQCLKRYHIEYVFQRKPLSDAEALKFGSSVHQYLDLLAQHNWQINPVIKALYDNDTEENHTQTLKIHAALVVLLQQPWTQVSMVPEQSFSIDLLKDAPYEFVLKGKIDGIHQYIREYKTTAKIDDDFWRRLKNGTQGTTYSVAEKHINNSPEYKPIEFIAISKPQIRLKKGETDAEYLERLIEKTEVKREIIYVTGDRINRWIELMQEHCKTMKLAYMFDHWPRSYQCNSHYTTCPYALYCLNGVPLEEITQPKSSQHEELEEKEENGNT